MTKNIPNAAGLAVLIAAALSITAPARAEPTAIGGAFSCFGSVFESRTCVWVEGPTRANPHIIHVPQPASDEERARAEARDKRWVARCNPRIVQDKFGVPRYVYAAAGCEYGKLD
jgi:hypothetical protein